MSFHSAVRKINCFVFYFIGLLQHYIISNHNWRLTIQISFEVKNYLRNFCCIWCSTGQILWLIVFWLPKWIILFQFLNRSVSQTECHSFIDNFLLTSTHDCQFHETKKIRSPKPIISERTAKTTQKFKINVFFWRKSDALNQKFKKKFFCNIWSMSDSFSIDFSVCKKWEKICLIGFWCHFLSLFFLLLNFSENYCFKLIVECAISTWKI